MQTVLDIRRPRTYDPSQKNKIGSTVPVPRRLPSILRTTNWYDKIRIGTSEQQAPEDRVHILPEGTRGVKFFQTKKDTTLEKARLLSAVLKQQLLLPNVDAKGNVDLDNLVPYTFSDVLKKPKLQELAVHYFSKMRQEDFEEHPYRKTMWAILKRKMNLRKEPTVNVHRKRRTVRNFEGEEIEGPERELAEERLRKSEEKRGIRPGEVFELTFT